MKRVTSILSLAVSSAILGCNSSPPPPAPVVYGSPDAYGARSAQPTDYTPGYSIPGMPATSTLAPIDPLAGLGQSNGLPPTPAFADAASDVGEPAATIPTSDTQPATAQSSVVVNGPVGGDAYYPFAPVYTPGYAPEPVYTQPVCIEPAPNYAYPYSYPYSYCPYPSCPIYIYVPVFFFGHGHGHDHDGDHGTHGVVTGGKPMAPGGIAPGSIAAPTLLARKPGKNVLPPTVQVPSPTIPTKPAPLGGVARPLPTTPHVARAPIASSNVEAPAVQQTLSRSESAVPVATPAASVARPIVMRFSNPAPVAAPTPPVHVAPPVVHEASVVHQSAPIVFAPAPRPHVVNESVAIQSAPPPPPSFHAESPRISVAPPPPPPPPAPVHASPTFSAPSVGSHR
jgi:hypothetical protein